MPRTKWMLPLGMLAILVVIGLLWFAGVLRSQEQAPQVMPPTAKPVPEAFAAGAEAFNVHCASCHGVAAVGTDQGPSFLSTVYASHHHGDASFILAVKQGVRAHHWTFGDMPPLPQVTPEQVTEIILYVRWLQGQADIR